MGFEAIHAAWNPHPTQRFAPGDGIGLLAGCGGKRIRHFCAPADDAANFFLRINKRFFHNVFKNRPPRPTKQAAMVALTRSGRLICLGLRRCQKIFDLVDDGGVVEIRQDLGLGRLRHLTAQRGGNEKFLDAIGQLVHIARRICH